jgi:hypothetical protein
VTVRTVVVRIPGSIPSLSRGRRWLTTNAEPTPHDTARLGDASHRLRRDAARRAGRLRHHARDHDTAVAVLRSAVALGVDHVDTSQSYGSAGPAR